MLLQAKSKKGISVMIGYVILIAIAIVMGTIVYAWLKSYVPAEISKCPDGTSIFVKNFVYDCANSLTLTLKNNGRFSLTGYFIHATDSPNQELATDDLSPYLMTGGGYEGFKMNSWIKFTQGGENTLLPGSEIDQTFQFPEGQFNKLVFLEIIPAIYQTENSKTMFLTCSNSRIVQAFNC